MTAGFTKLAPSYPNLAVPPSNDATKGWVTLATFDDPAIVGLGPGLLMGHVGLDLGNDPATSGGVRRNMPTDIRTRWMRGNGDPTGYQTHPVGTIKPWAAGVPYPEDISESDLPLDFQVWVKGTGAIVIVRKVVPAIFVPTVYAAEKLRLVVE